MPDIDPSTEERKEERPEERAEEPMSQLATPIPRSGFFFDRMTNLLARATRRGFWPMADQGIVSIGNFLTSIMVARGISKHDYGTFGVILEFMFFLNALQSGLIVYPLTVKGAVVDREGLRRFVSASLALTLLIGLPIVAATSFVGGAIGMFWVGFSAVVALIFWQLQETLRRGQWAQFSHKEAIVGDAISYVGQGAGIWLLMRSGQLTLPRVFLVMTVTSIVAIAVQAMQLGLRAIKLKELPQVAKEFWHAGRWVFLSSAGTIATSVCGSWPLYKFYGADQVAEFFAIGNLLKLCNPVIQSICGMVTPGAAKRLAHAGVGAAKRQALKFAALGGAMLAPYLIFILIAPALTMRILYGPKNAYLGMETAVRGCVIGYMCVYASSVIGAFLNGIHKTRYTFYGQVLTSIAQFVILLPMIIAFGLMGYVWGGVIQVVLQLIFLWFLMRKALMGPFDEPPIEGRGFPVIVSTDRSPTESE